ncbi:hypothetical protein KFK09_017564 [Dendrobium nobile]|uniref:Reverse transcriptase domain-containing protein n=1 Tax=Dendrobium nobile TaxID=94219 RepID=A0A8T3B1M7_DENNO|nr:hypothetical protein KFK09_017564 [Dendrobium nobile]
MLNQLLIRVVVRMWLAGSTARADTISSWMISSKLSAIVLNITLNRVWPMSIVQYIVLTDFVISSSDREEVVVVAAGRRWKMWQNVPQIKPCPGHATPAGVQHKHRIEPCPQLAVAAGVLYRHRIGPLPQHAAAGAVFIKADIRYEDVWETYHGAEAIVKKSWNKFAGLNPADSLNSKAKFKNLTILQDKLKEEIQELQLEEGEMGISVEKLQVLRFKINELNATLARLNSWWRQRAKARWMEEGDCNSGFFHAFANARKNNNWISHIKTKEGKITEDANEIQKVFSDFFQLKWKHRNCLIEGWPNPGAVINENDQAGLDAEFTREELLAIIQNSSCNIAPGVDGISEDIWLAVNHFMVSGDMPISWNETIIVLIPKIQNPQEVTNYRPICLCLTIYKIIANMLLSRLELVIHKLISTDQAAFIKGRSLSDHVLLAQEIFNNFRYSKARKGLLAIKLDMEQAYDSMGWDALRQVLSHFNFPTKFKELILQCILNPKYCISINGKKSDWIYGKSGFRQGCPLSPYLFILCSQILSDALNGRKGDIRISISPKAPRVSHLLYADDIFIFSECNSKVINDLKTIINNYCLCFFWKKNNGNTGIHYNSWKKLCKTKEEGGRGLFSAVSKIGPLRAKLAWNFCTKPSTMLNQILRAKYGDDVCWIMDRSLARWPTFVNCSENSELKLSYFISNGKWNSDLIQNTFGEHLRELILQVPIQDGKGFDSIELNSKFSVKSIAAMVFQSASHKNDDGSIWSWMKKLKLRPKIKLFWWRLYNDGLPSNDFLVRRKLSNFSGCPRGCMEDENEWHITVPENWDTNQRELFCSWYPPPIGWIKLNVDASILSNNVAGFGGVIRDEKGRFLLAFGINIMHWDIAQIELMAILHLKYIFRDWMFEAQGIIIEGDNFNIINLLQSAMKNWKVSKRIEEKFLFLLDFNQVYEMHDMACLKRSSPKKKFSLVSKDPATPPHRGRKPGHMKNQCLDLRILPTKEKGKAKLNLNWGNNEKQKISWADLFSEASDQEKDNGLPLMASPSEDFPPLPISSLLGPSPGGPSYADNVSAPAFKTTPFPVSFDNPGHKLSFNSYDLTEGKSLWTTGLIGYSLGLRPYYERLLKAMQKLWTLKGSMTLLSLADGFFLLKFSTVEDLELILEGGPWFLLGKQFILQRWSPKFKPKRDESTPIPIWIKIVDFSLALWTPTGISRIASYVGIPVSVDSLTANRSRLTFAWVYFLITKDSILPDDILLEIDGEDMVLKVLYDWKPDKCEGYGSLIHPFSICPQNPNPQPVLPPQPPKSRGCSTSRSRASRPHRSPSILPPPKPSNVNTSTASNQNAVNYSTSLNHIAPSLPSSHLPPRAPPIPSTQSSGLPPLVPPVSNPNPSPVILSNLPNLNSPTEDFSSSGNPISPRIPPPPKIPLINKFASLHTEEPNPSISVDSSSETETFSFSNAANDQLDYLHHDKSPMKIRSSNDKEKSPPKSKPSKGKLAKKAKTPKS